MDEIWVDVKGYEGYYQVSNKGQVRSLDRIVTGSHGKPVKVPGCVLKGEISKGYKRVNLAKDGKVKHMQVHRLVALNFLPNPDDLPEVNHKDENKLNNCLDNLEWCSCKYNINYGSGILKRYGARAKPVRQINAETGEIVDEFRTIEEAERVVLTSGIGGKAGRGNIINCCKGRRAKAYGYRWEYIPTERK